MHFFVVDETQDGVLLPLPELVRRLDFLPVVLWSFRDITLTYPLPFGLTVQEFERLSTDLSLGFMVSDPDFQNFLSADFQVIDGFIDAYLAESKQRPSLILECIDTSIWEISTPIDGIARELKRRGFKSRGSALKRFLLGEESG